MSYAHDIYSFFSTGQIITLYLKHWCVNHFGTFQQLPEGFWRTLVMQSILIQIIFLWGQLKIYVVKLFSLLQRGNHEIIFFSTSYPFHLIFHLFICTSICSFIPPSLLIHFPSFFLILFHSNLCVKHNFLLLVL